MKQKIFFTLLLITILLLVVLIACHTQKQTVKTNQILKKDSIIEVQTGKILKIATFNIQNMGKSKLAKPDVMDTLVTIIRKFDIVAIQEISDISNRTATLFLELVNKTEGLKFKMVCSNRTGREENDQNSREQYMFFYNPSIIQLVDTALYDDSHNDYFQREPFTAQFMNKQSGSEFLISTVHTSPENAIREIDALKYVVEWFPKRFGRVENIIFCGDFNASCSYTSSNELDKLAIRHLPYHWIIPDNANTNLSKRHCAYDRFVVNQPLFDKIKYWNIFRYFSSKRVSDHWPVFIEIEL